MPDRSVLQPEFTYIDTKTELVKLESKLKQAELVAVDTEGDSLYHYFEKVCLIQLTFDEQHYLVDPLVDLDLASLLAILSKKELLFHGGEFDLRMLKMCYDFKPHGVIFDTMLAAQVLGQEHLGLAALAKNIAGVELPKGDKKSDWSQRPLTTSQLSYAANDTRYLKEIADNLKTELVERGRLDWLYQNCQSMIRVTQVAREDPDRDREWRIKGVSKMTRRELSLIRAIWYFRDAESRQADRPPFKILGNQAIIDMAINLARQSSDGFDLPERLPRHFNASRKRNLNQVIKTALSLPESECPELLKSRPVISPGPEVEQLRKECSRLAATLDLPPSVLAPRAALEAISREQAVDVNKILEVTKLQRWQAEILHPAVKRIIGGLA